MCTNVLPHVSQTCGFSPVCDAYGGAAKVLEWAIALPHVPQTCGLSPECVRMCITKLPAVESSTAAPQAKSGICFRRNDWEAGFSVDPFH